MNFPSEFCRAPYQLVMRVPEGVTMTTAAGIRMLELSFLHHYIFSTSLLIWSYKEPKDRQEHIRTGDHVTLIEAHSQGEIIELF